MRASQAGAGRPLVAASYRGLRQARTSTTKETATAAAPPRMASSREIGRSCAPPRPCCGSRPGRSSIHVTWRLKDHLVERVRLDGDDARCLDRLDLDGAGARVVLELLLRRGVDVDLAGLVRGDVELDRLPDRDVVPLTVGGHVVAAERDVDDLGRLRTRRCPGRAVATASCQEYGGKQGGGGRGDQSAHVVSFLAGGPGGSVTDALPESHAGQGLEHRGRDGRAAEGARPGLPDLRDRHDAPAQRHGGDLRPGDLGLRPRHAGAAHRRPDRFRAALPPARAPGPRSPGEPGVDGRPPVRPRLPRTPFGPAASGEPGPAPRAGGADRLAAAGPRPSAVGGLLRRGARGRPRRGALQGPPGSGGRRPGRRPRPGAVGPDARAARARRRRLAARTAGVVVRPPARGGPRHPGHAVHRARHRARRHRLPLERRRRHDSSPRHRRQRAREPPVRAGHARSPARCRSSAAS